MKANIITYRRNLPHIHPQDGIFFITFRLYGSIPIYVLKELIDIRDKQIRIINKKLDTTDYKNEKYKIEKHFFAEYDNWLDNCKSGPVWLKEKNVAQIVFDKLLDFDENKYNLLSFCIMPNHVHLLIATQKFDRNIIRHSGKTASYYVADVLRLIKGNTARFCNKSLKRQGKFWHHESYDHFVRDEKELARIIKYILHNPVKAGLVQDYKDWEFNYYNDRIF